MSDEVVLQVSQSHAGAIRAVAVLHRLGISATAEEVETGGWGVRVLRDEAAAALAALADSTFEPIEDRVALHMARGSNASLLGVAWVSLLVTAVVALAFTRSALGETTSVLLAVLLVVTAAFVFVRRR